MKSRTMLNHQRNQKNLGMKYLKKSNRRLINFGIPEAEQKYLAGVSAQYESEVVYHNMKSELED